MRTQLGNNSEVRGGIIDVTPLFKPGKMGRREYGRSRLLGNSSSKKIYVDERPDMS